MIDTNVLISGFLSRKSHPAEVLDAWILGRFVPVVNPELVKEYVTVLARDKFAVLGSARERADLLEGILALPWVVMVYPQNSVSLVTEDPQDNRVLECAIEGRAGWVVTGDKHLLELNHVGDIAIVSQRRTRLALASLKCRTSPFTRCSLRNFNICLGGGWG
ncbi:MAG: putative toxin-antitoxin system toxin component, PIN family [Thermanaeromonas sp.]|uniref:putative toxin-antitoxin system toxin component, PIN family n=1 Tax=Thermanaeromonas sp. TaxID=2003697 RepID=UPI00243B30C2|nr:putative toxin-antitoxin system toxin component, PIN family [Thermanaeromonas sp.]MCG0279037.1 putative toxin-antitoxin system toxin component, PIN family [Thermanaeromonas sp.]